MSKLCQCKKQFISDLILETLSTGSFSAYMNNSEKVDEIEYSTGKVEDIEKILESDCVCEKKEDRPYYDTHKFSPTGWRKVNDTDPVCKCDIPDPYYKGLNNILQTCKNCDKSVPVSYESKEEKQSQSPCEHEWQQLFFNMPVNDQPGVVRRIQLPSWGCFKPNCGQVICKNPNDK